MEKFKFDVPAGQGSSTKQARQGPVTCEVYGCPRLATINTGQWNCRYHHGKAGMSLARITLALKIHEKEINWYEHVLNATVVDHSMGLVFRHAPYGFEPLADETLIAYRARLKKLIDELFAPQSREMEIAP